MLWSPSPVADTSPRTVPRSLDGTRSARQPGRGTGCSAITATTGVPRPSSTSHGRCICHGQHLATRRRRVRSRHSNSRGWWERQPRLSRTPTTPHCQSLGRIVFVPDSVDVAGHGVVSVTASGSVLGRGEVAQCWVAVIVLVLEVADHHRGFRNVGSGRSQRRSSRFTLQFRWPKPLGMLSGCSTEHAPWCGDVGVRSECMSPRSTPQCRVRSRSSPPSTSTYRARQATTDLLTLWG
jgi:hypothetical protein